MNSRPIHPGQSVPSRDNWYTGSPQHCPRHEMEGESQPTVGEWSDAMLARGRDVLTDGTLSADDPATTMIRLMVVANRGKVDLMRLVSIRMAGFRRDNAQAQQREEGR